jgi:hypothetical protein
MQYKEILKKYCFDSNGHKIKKNYIYIKIVEFHILLVQQSDETIYRLLDLSESYLEEKIISYFGIDTLQHLRKLDNYSPSKETSEFIDAYTDKWGSYLNSRTAIMKIYDFYLKLLHIRNPDKIYSTAINILGEQTISLEEYSNLHGILETGVLIPKLTEPEVRNFFKSNWINQNDNYRNTVNGISIIVVN